MVEKAQKAERNRLFQELRAYIARRVKGDEAWTEEWIDRSAYAVFCRLNAKYPEEVANYLAQQESTHASIPTPQADTL